MAQITVLCSDCNGKVTFTDETLSAIDVVGASFDCNICGSLMLVEKDMSTSNLSKKMANELNISHVIPSNPEDWQSVSLS
jgi:transcription initiation factor IIE alpha subunit